MVFPVLVRWHNNIESGPWSPAGLLMGLFEGSSSITIRGIITVAACHISGLASHNAGRLGTHQPQRFDPLPSQWTGTLYWKFKILFLFLATTAIGTDRYCHHSACLSVHLSICPKWCFYSANFCVWRNFDIFCDRLESVFSDDITTLTFKTLQVWRTVALNRLYLKWPCSASCCMFHITLKLHKMDLGC